MTAGLSFDEFWRLAYGKQGKAKEMYYHRCCDVWSRCPTSKAAKSHHYKESFSSLLAKIGKKELNKKSAFKAKLLLEELNWKIIKLDTVCTAEKKLPAQVSVVVDIVNPEYI